MRLTPRKEETKAVVELLEADGYPSADALAKDIIKRVFELILDRTDMYAFVHRTADKQPFTLLYGPFSSANEAEKFGKRACSGGRGAAWPLYAPTAALAHVALQDKGTTPPLCECGHPEFLHKHEGYAGKCGLVYYHTCHCVKFVAQKEAA